MSDTLYGTGANRIIAGGLVLANPIVQAGELSRRQIGEVMGMNLQDADAVPILDVTGLFSAFYSSSEIAAELICRGLAKVIRENTRRTEFRARTTDSLANEIRAESFRKFDAAIQAYTGTMQQLGIALESKSTLAAAVDGALTGGGLQFLTTGKSGKAGALIGGVLFAAIENAQQNQLRQQTVQCAIQAIHDLIASIPILSEPLMDQYATFVFGSDVDFAQRDRETERAQKELTTISKNADDLLNVLCLYSEASRKLDETVRKKVFLLRGPMNKNDGVRDILPFGCLFYPAFWRGFKRHSPISHLFGTLMTDPCGGKYSLRARVQKQMQPELIQLQGNIEAALTPLSNPDGRSQQLLA